MSVKLRFKRMGRIHAPFYRLSAVDSRTPRDGRVIEELGTYDPQNKDATKVFAAKIDRCKHWLDVGAIPSPTVSSSPAEEGRRGAQDAPPAQTRQEEGSPGRGGQGLIRLNNGSGSGRSADMPVTGPRTAF